MRVQLVYTNKLLVHARDRTRAQLGEPLCLLLVQLLSTIMVANVL